jgi:hypothetical protein
MHPLGKNPHSRYLLFGYMLPEGLAGPAGDDEKTGNKKPPGGGLSQGPQPLPVVYITRLAAA